MRIAIATDWFAPRRGGIEAQLTQLAAGLARRGHDVDVLTSTPGASSADGYRVRRIDVARLPGTQVAFSPRILDVLREMLGDGYDVVHGHVSVISPVGYAAAFIAQSGRMPAVVTFHSVLRHKRRILRATNAVMDLAGANVVWSGVSRLVASQLSEALGGASIEVLPNGLDLRFWTPAKGTAAPGRRDEVVLVSAMRLHPKKRPRQMLKAFARATRSSRHPALLRIIGDGPERASLERDIRRLGLSDGPARAELVSWSPADALRRFYAEADGFVLGSTRESFGIAALEAAASGLPVIAMAEGGCGEFLGDSPLLCADDDMLAETIARFIDDPAARGAGVVPLERLRLHDWPAVLARHEAVYDRAIQLSARGRPAVVA